MDGSDLGFTKGLTLDREDDINISDIIEVIQRESDQDDQQQQQRRRRQQGGTPGPAMLYNGGGVEQQPAAARAPSAGASPAPQPYVKIVEQPASKALRFRYECEGRSAGSIPGANSTLEIKTYPTIQVVGYKGKAVVVVSCVMKDSPYRAHPHNLVGREGCKKGVCTLQIPEDNMTVQFTNLGIQCVKKRDIENALRLREEIRVDPFRQGFNHRNQPTSIDLNAVRLCFQVFLESSPGKFSHPLTPVVSEPIFDKKAMCELTIIKLSDCVSYVDGGRKDIILLCEKVAKDDIQVRFFEEKDGQLVWEAFADVQPAQVHKQHAIWFRAPRYRKLDVTEPVKAFIQLRRHSDGAASEPLPFEFLPLDSGDKGKRKRAKIDDPSQIIRHLTEHDRNLPSASGYGQMNIMDPVKTEPRDSTSPYNLPGPSPVYVPNIHLSPQYYPNVGPSPSPETIQYRYSPNQLVDLQAGGAIQPTAASWTIQSGANVKEPANAQGTSWNVPASSAVEESLNVPNSLLFNMDTRQVDMDVDSGTLNSCLKVINENLPEINNLSLSDITVPQSDPNMSDSLTTLANNAHDMMYQNQ